MKMYEARGREADDLRGIVSEAIASVLAPEITIVDPTEEEWARIGEELRLQAVEPVFSTRDEGWFQQGLAVEQLLRRQGLDSGTGDEISLEELDALLASERSRNS